MTKAAEYTPATLAQIRTYADAGQYPEVVAKSLGWDRALLDSICRRHGITFVVGERQSAPSVYLWPAERAAYRNNKHD